MESSLGLQGNLGFAVLFSWPLIKTDTNKQPEIRGYGEDGFKSDRPSNSISGGGKRLSAIGSLNFSFQCSIEMKKLTVSLSLENHENSVGYTMFYLLLCHHYHSAWCSRASPNGCLILIGLRSASGRMNIQSVQTIDLDLGKRKHCSS